MSGRFEIARTALDGVSVVERRLIGDARGFLTRLYAADEFAGLVDRPIHSVNHTLTRERGAIRGMHFQLPPHAECKLVSVLRGEILDVAVDLRRGSSTFLQWHGERLSAENRRALVIPEGCAHGFQTLTEDCELLYLHTAAYNGKAEGGVSPLDPALRIAWPLPPRGLSERDGGYALISSDFSGI